MIKNTIYALSTVYGKSGVAIIRVSGAKAMEAINKMTTITKPEAKQAYVQKIYHAKTKEALDKGVVLFFKAPHSFTGEDMVEFQTHGSKAVISSLLDSLSCLSDFRMAEAGEFSKRAFYNGKMDLTEAEGLADLIDAQTKEQQKYAIKQMDGDLKNLYNGWREDLLQTLAYLEAYIDFPEENIPETAVKKLEGTVKKVKQEIKKHLSNNGGEKLKDGFRVVIAGAPNAGKSSLLNALANRQAAIVSNIAGTTRDAIDVYLDLKGYPVLFTDTAGLRQSTDKIEQLGVEVTKDKMQQADLIICLFDAFKDSVQVFDNTIKQYKNKILLVANKVDLTTPTVQQKLQKEGCILISAKKKQGLQELLQHIIEHVSANFNPDSGLLITRARYREALQEVLVNLADFNLNKDIELLTEDVRLATRNLGKITGKVEIDDILNKIFGDFCIGK